ncbi:NADH dehydrogenase [ubiquinone] flavoprotein 3, mitochondrial [Microtus ochrogaster]|uniref:NADH dehydrogenase [ubiquinone] flavoprotein 3, mitochondrial n=1 Tax=Microtus ochrogaster TaxID=79684 RepID=A0A8J6GYE2_MICOH|nr:NADH dehydrogenase [ubiquinone] flavoprotein 3, mitochondrial [Microtus ochrogaster]
MAVSLLLRGGRIRALKAAFLEARVFRELSSTVSLSTESGKIGKGIKPNPKKQSAPKDVVGAEERGKLLATHTAAAVSKSASPRSPYPAVENTGGAVAGPHPRGSLPLTDERLSKRLSRKTLVEFPQKVLSPPRVQGSDSEAQRRKQKVTNGSSSSSSSSSSDSDSDGEGHDSKMEPRVASKGKAGSYKPEASRPFQNGVPNITVPAKEKAKVQKPCTDVTYPEKSQQPKKKGTITKPIEDSKETRSKPVTSRSQSSEILDQNMKEEHPQGKLRPKPTLAPEQTDATTYKNLQHHDYNTYTFLDLNLDLSKFRMPQPSSGRESPRH